MALVFPNNPTVGQTHTNAGRAWQWTGARWQRYDIAGVIVSPTAPTNPVPGVRWIHEDQGRAYEYLDGTWVELGGGGGGSGGGVTSYNQLTDKPTLGTAAATDATAYATASQGAKADSALQSSALTPYRTASAQDVIDAGKASLTHDHDSRYYTETEIDTKLAAKQDAGSYATAAQGVKADSALQASALTPYRTASAQDVIDAGKASSSHAHGSITNAGAIGSTAGVPIITGASGVLQAGSFGTTSGTFAAGDHTHSNFVVNGGSVATITRVTAMPATPAANTLYIVIP